MKTSNIKVEELRIGNLLSYCGQPVIVLEVKRNHALELGYFTDSIGFGRLIGDENLSPIQLTEEWLEKFGFDNSLVSEIYLYQFDTVKFPPTSIIYDNGEYIFRKRCEVEIKTVHQLQNLYFALCGTELEIKNKQL